MTQEEKAPLLRDLCGRLPYGVKCKIHYTLNNETTFGEDVDAEENDTLVKIDVHTQSAYFDWYCDWLSIEEVKPFLRPMSSMTDEEAEEYNDLVNELSEHDCQPEQSASKIIDFYNKCHFDYSGLIPMGLALEAPEGMYEIVPTII